MLQCGVFSFEVLGTGALGTYPSIVASSDNERLLFNCGDGTQRLCTEYGARISKISRVYLTRNSPFANGGLGGFLLTRSDLAQGGSTALFGPPGLGKIVKSYRHFYQRPNCMISAYEVGHPAWPTTTSDGIVVQPILVGGPDRNNHSQDEKRGRVVSPGELGRGFEIFESQVPPHSEKDIDFAVSYVISLPERRGKFHPQKALELGVKPGRDYGKLTRGETIILENGRLVTPQDCMDKAEPPPMAMVVCCPSIQHFEKLIRMREMEEVQREHAAQLACIIHFTPFELFRSNEYQQWAHSFDGKVAHVSLGEGLSPERSIFRSSCSLHCRLSVLSSEAFPFREPTVGGTATSRFGTFADVRTRFILAPSRLLGLDTSKVAENVDPSKEIETAKQLLSSSAETSPNYDHLPQTFGSLPSFKTLFLGTGSAIPSKYRNVSALMIFPSENKDNGAIMVDCGEGSVLQLARSEGSMNAARRIIRGLSFCWISHMHADHHLGLLTLLGERIEAGDLQPLVVCGPTGLNHFLLEYGNAIGGHAGKKFVQSFVFLDCEAMLKEKQVMLEPPALRMLKERARLKSAISVPVLHCYKAYGLVLEYAAGGKLVYSGDTEVCSDLIKEGMGANVLIHEATFEDGKEDEAKEKKHSTISQALHVGMSMKADTIVFTHFSQRYPKYPPISNEILGSTITAVFAFDLMQFDMANARNLALRAADFQKLLDETDAEEDGEDDASSTGNN